PISPASVPVERPSEGGHPVESLYFHPAAIRRRYTVKSGRSVFHESGEIAETGWSASYSGTLWKSSENDRRTGFLQDSQGSPQLSWLAELQEPDQRIRAPAGSTSSPDAAC